MKFCTRRTFLQRSATYGGIGIASAMCGRSEAAPVATALRFRPDLVHPEAPEGTEVIQLTADTIPSCHVYMEAQIFTPDSKRFVLHRSAHAHGGSKDDPAHQYLLCDIEDGCSLSPLTEELGVTAPSLSPEGEYLYYFVNETEVNGGRLTLKRVRLDATERETLLVLDAGVPGTGLKPSHIYPLSTISSDGERLALSAFFGDGEKEDAPYGLMVFDLRMTSVNLILQGQTWCNLHPQYSRSQDAEAKHDILIQENHGNKANPRGEITTLVSGDGADIHVIRDDGTSFRTMPWGRDGNEHCQGHQCWRGRSEWAITSTGTNEPRSARLIEGKALPDAGHLGLKTPGGIRNDLTRELEHPDFYHFATDIAGKRLISDTGPMDPTGRVVVAELGVPGEGVLENLRSVAQPKCSWVKGAHMHPFLSPDGTMGFFNSDESGVLQAYMVRGF
ncbi:MAG: hypothetical protein IT364_11875 [Candidatus Hydrogenedentes bacterium]|nr:hypothetical protein [Candidatus Hydrogenedentota bacterium]